MNKKVLRWNYVFQYGWVITNVINSILLFPIYLNKIDKDTLGIWVATSSVLSWMTLVDPGVGEVLQQKIAEMRGRSQVRKMENATDADLTNPIDIENDNVEIGKSIGSGFIASAIILMLSVIVGIICFFSVGFLIDKNISQFQNLSVALLITIIATGMSLVSFTVSGINQGMHNSAHVAISSLTANFLFLIVNLIFLYLGYGVMSIALANVCRALYINIFNFISLLNLLKREGLSITYEMAHFKKFIRIFSFTSASKIISGLAGGIDMLILARFIPPSMIAIYELNKRPVNQANALIGRHSVALMPVISHAKGTGDKSFIINLIHKQFKVNVYVSLFAAFIFIITYRDFLYLWAGKNTFLGYTILILLVTYSVAGLVAYFMNNVGYALGDIKANSKFYIVKSLVYSVMIVFAAKYYGIKGTLFVAVVLCILFDFFFFVYRNHKMGYINLAVLKKSILTWAMITVLCAAVTWGCFLVMDRLIPEQMHLSKVIIGASLFTLFYLSFVFIADKEILGMALDLKKKLIYNPVTKKLKASLLNK